MVDASIPALQDAIRHMYGLEATWIETVPVGSLSGFPEMNSS
jgi:hypothetical protein